MHNICSSINNFHSCDRADNEVSTILGQAETNTYTTEDVKTDENDAHGISEAKMDPFLTNLETETAAPLTKTLKSTKDDSCTDDHETNVHTDLNVSEFPLKFSNASIQTGIRTPEKPEVQFSEANVQTDTTNDAASCKERMDQLTADIAKADVLFLEKVSCLAEIDRQLVAKNELIKARLYIFSTKKNHFPQPLGFFRSII